MPAFQHSRHGNFIILLFPVRKKIMLISGVTH